MEARTGTKELLEPPLHTFLHKNLRGDLFHGKMRGIDVRNVLATEQILHLAHFELALGVARIAAVGLALVADRGEAVRVDGQAEQLVLVGAQGGRQLSGAPCRLRSAGSWPRGCRIAWPCTGRSASCRSATRPPGSGRPCRNSACGRRRRCRGRSSPPRYAPCNWSCAPMEWDLPTV